MSEAIVPLDPGWKARLGARIPSALGSEIDAFELELVLRKQGKLEEKTFAETRLRRGAYGQRYDHGQRHDGEAVQSLDYEGTTKGPNTAWDAPGMQRIKLPYGALSAEQLETLAELAEEYADGILHVTTRQDLQLHYVHIEDTPDLMRRLAAVGVTSKEACGNSVRNVTACPYAGVCQGEAFDVTPYAHALSQFLLGHPDAQEFGRKFKIAFSGCAEEACGLASMHDLGFIARTRAGADGAIERGFELWVGGGLGAVPHQAQVLDAFVPEREILPLSQAVCRVFARLGEKKARHKARLKFLVAKLGIDTFRSLVAEERPKVPADPRHTAFLDTVPRDPPRPPVRPLIQIGRRAPESEDYQRWRATNLRAQRQEGLFVVSLSLPLGDLSSDQARALAAIARRYSSEPMRTTVEQNIVLRQVSELALPELYQALLPLGLAEPTAGTLVDVTACPGTDTCKLGIASSRGLAGELRTRLAATAIAREEAVEHLRIKVSGCFNSCGQHHVADIGFYGVSRKLDDRVVPHFQVVLGGKWKENAGAFGLALGAVPSKHIPEVVDRILTRYLEARREREAFHDWVQRTGKAGARALFEDLIPIPSYELAPELYTDFGDARVFSMKDQGVGECAGEVVSGVDFALKDGEREAFAAQLLLEQRSLPDACARAFAAMLLVARALVKEELWDVPEEPDVVVNEFKTRFHDSERFHDPFAGGRFAHYFFRAHEEPLRAPSHEQARQRVEEAQLFIEGAHGYVVRKQEGKVR